MNPFLERIRASLPAENVPFALIVRGRVAAGREAEFLGLAEAVARGTRAEEGNEWYRFFRSADDPRRFVLLEAWRDFPALVAHFETPHLQQYVRSLEPLAEGETEVEILPAP